MSNIYINTYDIWTFPASESVSTKLFTLYGYFANQISFEFYNDAACTQPSSGQTGIITITGSGSANSIYQAIPDGASINIATPISLSWAGVTNQLEVQVNTPLQNTNYVRIYFFRG